MIGEMIDRAILPFAPGAAVRRAANRRRFRHLATFGAAEKSRRTREWNPGSKSANEAIIPDLAVMTARARQMVRDNPHARSIVGSFRRNVVGRGIMPAAAARKSDGSDDSRFNQAMNTAFMRWANDPGLCDAEGRKSLWDIQRMTVGQLVEAGEMLVIWSVVDNGPGELPLQLHLVEGEQFDMEQTSYKGNRVIGGVEVDARGRTVAYHIRPQTLDSYPSLVDKRSTQRVVADRARHLFIQERPGQVRGYTWLAPILKKLRDVDEYDLAMLWAARMEASIGLVIHQDDPGGVDGRVGLHGPDDEEDVDGNEEINIQPGMVARLGKNEKAEAFAPTRPGGTYDPYMRFQLRSVAAGADLSYPQVARDFSEGNFSSQRQAKLEDQRCWEPIQDYLIGSMLQPIWKESVRLAFLTPGVLPSVRSTAPTPDRFACEWRPPGWDWIDPGKEINAAAKALDYRLTTRRRLLAEQGMDWRDTLRQVADEADFASERGVSLPEDKAASPAGQPPEPGDSGDEGGGGG